MQLANAFTSLTDFQVNSEDGVHLHPQTLDILPTPDPGYTNVTEDDLDDEFLTALGVIHHNDHITFDDEMTDLSPSIEDILNDSQKRRKREDFKDPQQPSPMPHDLCALYFYLAS